MDSGVSPQAIVAVCYFAYTFEDFVADIFVASFGGLFYLSLYLAAKLHVLDSRGEAWKLFVVMAPTLGASLVAGSRIMDARHHPFDVITGTLIGIVFAWAAYRQYFPAISDCHAKGRAYPMVHSYAHTLVVLMADIS
jgi:diacylglycerol diphosphate phosphatase/phosphatidate phosphatase